MTSQSQLVKKHFSKTSIFRLINYYSNPREYYEKNINKSIKSKPNRIADFELDIGTCVHLVLEKVLVPYLKMEVSKDDYGVIFRNVHELVYRSNFVEKYLTINDRVSEPEDTHLGMSDKSIRGEVNKNNVDELKKAKDIIYKKTNEILVKDKARFKDDKSRKIIGLESIVASNVNLPDDDFFLRGFIDRIEERDGTITLIEYTIREYPSAVELINLDLITPQELVLHSLFKFIGNAWLYWSQSEEPPAHLDYQIISSENPSSTPLKLTLSAEYLRSFEDGIKKVHKHLLSMNEISILNLETSK